MTKRLAEDWLRSVLEEARRGTLRGLVRTGATFADAAAEWLRYIEHDRGRKPSTVAGYKVMVRSMLLPVFGELQHEAITTAMIIERWIGSINLSASTRTKAILLLHGIFARAKKVWGLPSNPVADGSSRARLPMLFDTEGRPPPPPTCRRLQGEPAFIAFRSGHVVSCAAGYRSRRQGSDLQHVDLLRSFCGFAALARAVASAPTSRGRGRRLRTPWFPKHSPARYGSRFRRDPPACP